MIAVKEGFRYSDLKEARPHGSLCTLNRFDRVQRSEEEAETGMMLPFEGGMEQGRVAIVREDSGQMTTAPCV
jgi:hypothetical protein